MVQIIAQLADPTATPKSVDIGGIATSVTGAIAAIAANPIPSIIGIVVALAGGIIGFILIKNMITSYLEKLAKRNTEAGKTVFVRDETDKNRQNTDLDNSGRDELNKTK